MNGLTESDPEQQEVTTSGLVLMSAPVGGTTGREVEDALRPYPSLRDSFGVTDGETRRAGPTEKVLRRVNDDDGIEHALIAQFVPAQVTMAELWRHQRSFATVVEVDQSRPRYPSPYYMGYALPEVAGGPCPLPLMLWWALLLGLSSLARYEPAVWTAAIDLDSSDLAIALERVLDIATERVPTRIMDALQN